MATSNPVISASGGGDPGEPVVPSKVTSGIFRLVALALIPMCTFAASIFVAEGAFRFAGTRVASTMEGFYEPFGEGTFKHKPGASVFMNWSSGAFQVHIDADGMRAGAPVSPSQTPTREPDVLILGNSEAFGQGQDFEPSTMGQFAARGHEAGLTVANAAVIGHFPRNQLELLDWFIMERGLRPRVVLITPTPHYVGYVHDYFKSYVHQGALFDGPPDRKTLLKKWLLNHSAVYVTVRDAFKPAGDNKEAHATTFQLFEKGEKAEARVRLFAEHLRAVQELIKPWGGRVVVAYMPVAVENEMTELARSQGFMNHESFVPRDISRVASQAVDVAFIDLSPAIEETLAAGEPQTLPGDPHFSAQMSARAGRLLWEGLDWRAMTR
jgi:hypothetical protein